MLRLRREVLGEYHPDTLASMNILARIYQRCGKLEAAEKMQEVLRLYKEVLGEHNPDTLTSINNLENLDHIEKQMSVVNVDKHVISVSHLKIPYALPSD